jgi:vacuolar iron transporter family protein
MDITDEMRQQLLTFQKNEITEYHIYKRLAKIVRSQENRQILDRIADDERRHYDQWRVYTQQHVAPDRLSIWAYYLISRVFGFTFGVKLMERGEEDAQDSYEQLRQVIPQAEAIVREENQHETALLQMLDEERLRYTGSMVLGLSDALVELTGALAGLTFALQDTRLVALTGSITGIAAALSMGASEYLSTKTEDTTKNPLRASIYTGAAYLIAVVVLILPYLLLTNHYVCLAFTLAGALLIIALFTYYVSVANDEPFRRRFFEMAGLSFAIAGFSFFVGFLLRTFMGVDV